MRWFCLLLLFMGLTTGHAVAQETSTPGSTAAVPPVYRLNPGDVVRISVWREDELLREARIQPDGTVSYPLAGSVQAAGRSPDEVAATIKDRLTPFISDAVVTVELLEAQGYRVYVVGEVNRPGEYQLAQPITVLQALSIAGGLTPFAGESGIRILRTDMEGQANIEFNYNDVASRGEMEKNIFLKSGDTVIVPSSFF